MRQNQTMYKKGELVKQRIVQTANNLFYHQGFNQTSFTDIADELGTPKGNFYHYFKTKEEILDQVIEQRREQIYSMLKQIDAQSDSPADRIKRFLDGLLLNKTGYCRYGSPVGSLINELGKQQDALKNASTELLRLVHDWLVAQLLSASITANDARKHARRLLARLEGTILVAHAFNDADYLTQEIDDLKQWMESLLTPQTSTIQQAG